MGGEFVGKKHKKNMNLKKKKNLNFFKIFLKYKYKQDADMQ
jgi:hypothetical protein